MCRIYAGQDPANYEPITRSIRISGATTSIRLEAGFWAILDELANGEGISTGRFITKLHDEVLHLQGEARNFSSLLRVTCLLYLENRVPTVAAEKSPEHVH